MIQPRCMRSSTQRNLRAGGEAGAVVVVVMVFMLVCIIVSVSLFWLVSSHRRAAETERTDVKSFNVAEAGVDAGMLALKLDWPTQSGYQVTVDLELLKQSIQGDPTLSRLWDPNNPSEFIQVEIYDNVDAAGNLTWIPNMDPATRVLWDSNSDGMMFVDATANVDNDRHRILILAQKEYWQLTFPVGMALFAGAVDSNGKGLAIEIENGLYATYDVQDTLHKGINPGDNVEQVDTPTTFDAIFTPAMQRALEGIAVSQGTYFEDVAEATKCLTEPSDAPAANGKVVYVRSNSAISIASSVQIGTEDEPVIVVLDTPDGSVNTWDLKGTADFYGIIVNLGDTTLRGTCSTHGALYSEGTLLNKGTGALPEIYYNQKVINNLNRQYTISVSIVPNTWEEYTLPRSDTASAGP